MPTTRPLTLLSTLIVLVGCTPSEFTSEELEAPTANVSGRWMGPAGREFLVLKQDGPKVTGGQTYLLSNKMQEFMGTVTGRVLRAKITWGGGVVPATFSQERNLVISPDGMTAHVRQEKRTFTRVSPILASQNPRTASDAALGAGEIILLPVGTNGEIGGQDPRLREVLVTGQYARDAMGKIRVDAVLIPLDEPRRAKVIDWHYVWGHTTPEAFWGLRGKSPLHAWRSGTVDGKQVWWMVSPAWADGDTHLTPRRLVAELYPDTKRPPVEIVPVAVREGSGPWRPAPHYLTTSRKPILVRLLVESGRPGKLDVRAVDAPPLVDFLVVRETSVPTARWRNRMLLFVKTNTLPVMLRELTTRDLSAEVVKVEQAILDLNHEGELLKSRMQKLEQGGPDGVASEAERKDLAYIEERRRDLVDTAAQYGEHPQTRPMIARFDRKEREIRRQQSARKDKRVAELNEMSIAHFERIDILKPIVAAMKEELVNRQR
jgi:hypothetical protein